jgi:hypothetical protein
MVDGGFVDHADSVTYARVARVALNHVSVRIRPDLCTMKGLNLCK